jgi:hypothetical protein
MSGATAWEFGWRLTAAAGIVAWGAFVCWVAQLAGVLTYRAIKRFWIGDSIIRMLVALAASGVLLGVLLTLLAQVVIAGQW